MSAAGMDEQPEQPDPAVERARRSADRMAGRASRGVEMVLEGHDGWLFLQGDSNDVIGQHTGRVILDDDVQREWAEIIEARVELARKLDFVWECLIAPDKEAVYADYLPDGVVPAARRPIHTILEIAEAAGASFTYPVASLQEAAKDRLVYSPTGTHWNHWGAFIAYIATCRSLRKRGIDIPAQAIVKRWIEFEHPDDLGEKLGSNRAGEAIKARLQKHEARLVFNNHVQNHGRIMVFERDDSQGPSAVVLGESFTNYLLMFLKESFRRLVFVHTSTFPRAVLERERPDVVLSYPTERFLVRSPRDETATRDLLNVITAKRERGLKRRKLGWFFRTIPGLEDVDNDFELPWDLR